MKKKPSGIYVISCDIVFYWDVVHVDVFSSQ